MPAPGNDASAMERIRFLLERNRIAAAKPLIAETLAHSPDDPALRYFSAYVDYAEDRNEEALAQLESLLADDPHHPAARELRFDVLVENGHYAEAEPGIIDLIRDYPEEPEYYAKYAMLMLRTHHLEKASLLAGEAIRLDPENMQALLVSTLCALIREPSAVARERLTELLQRYPEAEATSIALIVVLHQDGRDREALRVARELLRANPQSPDAVDLVIELQVTSHWSMLPMRPFLRHGWVASALMWIIAVGSLMMLARSPYEHLTPLLAVLWLAFVVYTWTYPSLLRRLMRA